MAAFFVVGAPAALLVSLSGCAVPGQGVPLPPGTGPCIALCRSLSAQVARFLGGSDAYLAAFFRAGKGETIYTGDPGGPGSDASSNRR